MSDGHGILLKYINELEDKLKLVVDLLYEHCEDYGDETCREGYCLGDPDWAHCLARRILDVLGEDE